MTGDKNPLLPLRGFLYGLGNALGGRRGGCLPSVPVRSGRSGYPTPNRLILSPPRDRGRGSARGFGGAQRYPVVSRFSAVGSWTAVLRGRRPRAEVLRTGSLQAVVLLATCPGAWCSRTGRLRTVASRTVASRTGRLR